MHEHHHEKCEETPEQQAQQGVPENAQQPQDAGSCPNGDQPAPALSEAEAAAQELQKWQDLARRTAAEYDNYRKRMVKEKAEDLKYSNSRLLSELLPVVDNFEMGMMAAAADTSSMIYIGMNMVKKQLDDFLSGQGVSVLEPKVGDMYDHKTQEALQSEPSESPEGTILRVIRKGYKLNDRLLRPANVVVARKVEPAAPAESYEQMEDSCGCD